MTSPILIDADNNDALNGTAYRYPGPESFQDTAVGRRIFFGRSTEVSELTRRIYSNKLVVLYGKSGLGKTSLLQAAVFPELRERNFVPLPIRFNKATTDSPTKLILGQIEADAEKKNYEYYPGDGENMWDQLRTAIFVLNDCFSTPVLVFDQFEEVFTLQNEDFRSELSRELGYLVSGAIPPASQERLLTSRNSGSGRVRANPPELRILFSLREEYVGSLEEFAWDTPRILENRFRIQPLDEQAARRAIVKPPAIVDPSFRSPSFTYKCSEKDDAVADLIAQLKDTRGRIEPFALQVVCARVERKVIRRYRNGDAYSPFDLGCQLEPIEKIIDNFYLAAIRGLSNRQRRRARRLCEYGLLSPEGFRETLGSRQIQRTYALSDSQLDELIDARLLRREFRQESGEFQYELIHDSVAQSVKRKRRFRIPAKLVALMFFLGISGVMILLLQRYQLTQAETARAQAEAAEFRAEAELTKERNNSLQREVAQKTMQIEEQRSRIDTTQARLAELDKQIQSQEQTTQAERDKLLAEQKRLQQESLDASKNIASLNSKREILEAEISRFRQDLIVSEDWASELSTRLERVMEIADIVDCLLPGSDRKLGKSLTYQAPRRPVRITSRDCEIRGGEFVSRDQADFQTALKVWLLNAEEGNPEAQFIVGEIFERGYGEIPDLDTARKWYRRAAEQGYESAVKALERLDWRLDAKDEPVR